MATVKWQGDAPAVAQVDKSAVGGTWANGDTIDLTMNGKTVTITIGDNVTVDEVITTIVEAFNGSTLTDTAASVSPDPSTIPEFAEITASADTTNDDVVLTADTAGKPFTAPTVSVTSSMGTMGAFSTDTSSAGPNHWDTAGNWDTGSVPVNSDDVVFDDNDVDCLYGLAQSAVTLASLTIRQGYTGKIGLPNTNEDGTTDYAEYRETYLEVSATALTVGEGDGNGSGRIKLDLGSNQFTANVFNSGQAENDAIPSLLLKGTHASNELNIIKGNVGVAIFAGESATLLTLRTSFADSVLGDVTLQLGSGVTLNGGSAAISIGGGTVEINSATTAIDMTDGELSLFDGAHAELNIDGGTCFYRSTGTLTQGRVGSDGELSCAKDLRSRTFTNLELNEGSTFRDPFKTVTFTNPIQLPRTGVEKLGAIQLGDHYTLQRGAI